MRPSEIEFSVIAGRKPEGVREKVMSLTVAPARAVATFGSTTDVGTKAIRRFPVIATDVGVGLAVMRESPSGGVGPLVCGGSG
jgi:hypothetical protein